MDLFIIIELNITMTKRYSATNGEHTYQLSNISTSNKEQRHWDKKKKKPFSLC